MQKILNHQKSPVKQRQITEISNTYKSNIFSSSLDQKNHKKNLGHQKDLKTSELFGDHQIEPLRKIKVIYDQPTYKNENISALERKAKEFNSGVPYEKIIKTQNSVENDKSQNLSSFDKKLIFLKSSILSQNNEKIEKIIQNKEAKIVKINKPLIQKRKGVLVQQKKQIKLN